MQKLEKPYSLVSLVKRILPLTLAAGLAACQSQSTPPALVGTPSAPAAQHTATAPAPVHPDAENVTIAFQPFSGVPGNIADSLSQKLGTKARVQGLHLVRRQGATPTYWINGYLSATGESSASTLFYVFDIVDAHTGRRLKRISGTETSSGASGDPWNAISDTSLDRIATRSIVEISAWINRSDRS